MIRQDRKPEKIDPDVRCQQTQLVLDPDLAMVKVLSRDRIVPRQKATTNHAIYDMHNRHFFCRKQLHAGKPLTAELGTGTKFCNRVDRLRVSPFSWPHTSMRSPCPSSVRVSATIPTNTPGKGRRCASSVNLATYGETNAASRDETPAQSSADTWA